MNTKNQNQICCPETKQTREKESVFIKNQQHFERIAMGNALSEIEQEAELRYVRQLR